MKPVLSELEGVNCKLVDYKTFKNVLWRALKNEKNPLVIFNNDFIPLIYQSSGIIVKTFVYEEQPAWYFPEVDCLIILIAFSRIIIYEGAEYVFKESVSDNKASFIIFVRKKE
jgi:hypothetical protein